MKDHYMSFDEVKLKQPLENVKRATTKNGTLVVPESILDDILSFFHRDKIEYHRIDNPALYPAEDIKKDMQRYIDIAERFQDCDPILLITPFDADALFEWSKQVFGDTKDPSYQAYLDDLQQYGEDYYNELYEFRP